MRTLLAILSAVVLSLWGGPARAQDGPDVDLPKIGEPDAEPGGCSHRGRHYAEGAVICKDGMQAKCSAGGWENRGDCPPEDVGVNGASVPGPVELQKPPPDDELAPEELQPAEP